MSEIIKPCPFCGNGVILAKDNYGKYLIECKTCSLLFGVRVEDGTELIDGWRAAINTAEEAAEAWNKRIDATKRHFCSSCKWFSPLQDYLNGNYGGCHIDEHITKDVIVYNKRKPSCERYEKGEYNGGET